MKTSQNLLIGRIVPSVGLLAMEALKRLDAEDLLHVVHVTHNKMSAIGQVPILSEDEAVLSLKQYYALPILFPEKKELAVSSVVDAYWHNHVLNTKSYRNFCGSVYGHFMDHVPLDKSDKPESARVTALYTETRGMLEATFGQHVSEKAYPKEATADIVICTYEYE
jgi:hypothetical protein